MAGDGVWVIVDPSAGGLAREVVGDGLVKDPRSFVGMEAADGSKKGIARLSDGRLMFCEWKKAPSGQRSTGPSRTATAMTKPGTAATPGLMSKPGSSATGYGIPGAASALPGDEELGTLAKLRGTSPHRASTSSTRPGSKGYIQVVGGLYPGAVKEMVNLQPDLQEIRKIVIDRAGKCFLNVKDAFRNLQRIVTYRDGAHRVGREDLRAFVTGQLSLTKAVSDTIFEALVEPGELQIPHTTLVDFFGATIPWPEVEIREEKERPVEVSGRLPVGNQLLVGDSNEDSFWKVREMIMRRIILRYKNVRQAFNGLDDDEDGLITRDQIRVWFKQMSVPMEMADRMFDEIDIDHNGFIDWPEFQRFFGNAFGNVGLDEGGGEGGAATGGDAHPSEQKATLMPGHMHAGGARHMSLMERRSSQESNLSAYTAERRGSFERNRGAKVSEQMAGAGRKNTMTDPGIVSEEVLQKLSQRFASVREAFHAFDRDRDQRINRSELRQTMKDWNFPPEAADILFNIMDVHNHGHISYLEFMDWAGPVLEPAAGRGTYRGTQVANENVLEEVEEELEEGEEDGAPGSASRLPPLVKSQSVPAPGPQGSAFNQANQGGGLSPMMILQNPGRSFVYTSGGQGGAQGNQKQQNSFPRSVYSSTFKAPEPKRMLPRKKMTPGLLPGKGGQDYSPSGYQFR